MEYRLVDFVDPLSHDVFVGEVVTSYGDEFSSGIKIISYPL
jgi:hypothetical protein